MTLSVWMRAARPVDGGLLVPGRPRRGGCDLLLDPDGAHVLARDLRVHLPWNACRAQGDESWWLGQWTWGRGGPIGVGITATGTLTAPIDELRRRRRTFANLVDRLADRSNIAPLYAAHTLNARVDADRDALSMLFATLARKPDWRPQLARSKRVSDLLQDLATHDHEVVAAHAGARRQAMESFIAMQQLGFEHPHGGRPMPDDPGLDGEAVVRAVIRHLAANRHARPVDESYVSTLVHKHYIDIGPWPFAALLPPATS